MWIGKERFTMHDPQGNPVIVGYRIDRGIYLFEMRLYTYTGMVTSSTIALYDEEKQEVISVSQHYDQERADTLFWSVMFQQEDLYPRE